MVKIKKDDKMRVSWNALQFYLRHIVIDFVLVSGDLKWTWQWQRLWNVCWRFPIHFYRIIFYYNQDKPWFYSLCL